MKQQVASGGGGPVASSGELSERMQLARARAGEQPVPGVRADRGDHLERPAGNAEADRALQRGHVAQQFADDVLAAGVDRQDKKHRRRGQRAEHRLWFWCLS